jgi:ATP-dependent Clp protease protease subunit
MIRRTKTELNQLQSQHTGQSIEQIEKDSDRDRWFTAQEALEYGFVDHVVSRAAMTDNSNPVTDN